MRGPQECLEHGSIIFTLRKKPSWFPRGAAKILSKSQLRKSGMVEYIFDEMAESVIFQQLCAVNLNTKLLTSVQGEADILSRLAPRDEAATSVASLCAGLAHEIPLLSDLPLRSVLKLRMEEPTAFDQYRFALSGILAEYVSKQKVVRPSDARLIYKEKILPEILRLRRRAETYRKPS
jgi:hypothetical protein